MRIAGFTLGHHGVAGLQVAQDQVAEGPLLDLVLLVLSQICSGSQPRAVSTWVPLCSPLPMPWHWVQLTIDRDPIDPPGDLWLGPALYLAVQAGRLSWCVQLILGLAQPIRGSYVTEAT